MSREIISPMGADQARALLEKVFVITPPLEAALRALEKTTRSRLLISGSAGSGRSAMAAMASCMLCHRGLLKHKQPLAMHAMDLKANPALLRSSLSAAAREGRLLIIDEADSLSLFPEENGLRGQMDMNRKYCEMYADKFPTPAYPNLVLSGGTGLGKTFLLNCIYERVVSRNYPAVRVTAFRMFEAMRRQHFGSVEGELDFEQLLNVPLLLIDDLGSEPMVKNITREYLFTLLNERISAGKGTVIATNLSTDDLEEVYGERVRSRLADQRRSIVLKFTGKDLRKRD